MTHRFQDATSAYHLSADWAARGPLLATPVRLSRPDDAHRLLTTFLRAEPSLAGTALRRLLDGAEPTVQMSRMTDLQVVDRLARHVASGRVGVWREPAPQWARADVSVAVAEGVAEVLAAAPRPAAPSAPHVSTPDLPSCREVWAQVDREVAGVLAQGGDANPVERNRHITAAYAQYYQRMQARGIDNPWGGIAAIVSGQAGCSITYANEMIARGEAWDRAADGIPVLSDPHVAPWTMMRGTMEALGIGYQELGQIVKDGLAKTNKLIFTDIYPVLRVHEQYGSAGISRCGNSRPPPSGPVSDELKEALVRVDRGTDADLLEAGRLMAEYEQQQIVQNQVLNDPLTRAVFDLNQAAAQSESMRAFGARKPELALTAECPPYSPGTEPVPFRGRFTVKRRRVQYYQSLARAFERMPAGNRARVLRTLVQRGR